MLALGVGLMILGVSVLAGEAARDPWEVEHEPYPALILLLLGVACATMGLVWHC